MTKNVERLTLDELVTEYVDCATVHCSASIDGRSEVANRAHYRLRDLSKELRTRPEGQDALVRLLDHQSIKVRVWAAFDSVEFAREQAMDVYEQILSGPPSLERLMACCAMQRVRDGTFRYDP